MSRRLAAFVGALLLALLAAEGALSLLAGRSLRELREAPGPAARRTAARPAVDEVAAVDPDAELGEESGIFSVHEDALVGYVLKREAELTIYEGAVSSDHLGLRRRPGPPPPDDALRLVVLGDSIAFGFGVDDDQTLAARLEARLAELRGPAARPIACRTVAIPSWNHRAAPAFLLDHWDELRPDIVLYLPCRNDVCDTDSADAAGLRRVVPDPASSDPWLAVSVRTLLHGEARRMLAAADGPSTEDDLGLDALFSDVCAESRRRHDENAESVARLQRLLVERDCKLLVVWNSLGDYTWFLSSRLARLAPGLPMLALLRWTRDEFTLGFDPHPNAESLDVWARWLAADLVERGWISRGAGAELPPVPRAYAELRGELGAPDDFGRKADEARARAAHRLRSEIDFKRGLGVLQVIGGLNRSGTARQHLLAILDPAGTTLRLELEPLAARLDLYPLQVAVEANGVSLGAVTLRSDAVLQASLPLPAALDRSQPLEVRLLPERWVVRRADGAPGPGGRAPMTVDWCRPVRLACRP